MSLLASLSKRTKFFLGHLAISAMVSLIVLMVVFFVWYPSPLADVLGVKTLILLLVGIDVIIGPVLGFLVYKEGKKTLKMDLTVIICIQILAFVVGLYSIAQGRPAWVVYSNSTMHVVKRSDVDDSKIANSASSVSWTGPKYVSINQTALLNRDLFSMTKLSKPQNDNLNVIRNPSYYVPLNHQDVTGLPLDALYRFNDNELVDRTLRPYPNADRWVALSSSRTNMVMLLDSQADDKILGIVDLRAW